MGSRAGTDEDNAFQIGRLAEETGISASAIRFYERRGLISPPREYRDGGSMTARRSSAWR